MFVLLITSLLSCTKDNSDDVETLVYYDQKVLVINYTAASCYNCGSWGAPLAHDLEKSDGLKQNREHNPQGGEYSDA